MEWKEFRENNSDGFQNSKRMPFFILEQKIAYHLIDENRVSICQERYIRIGLKSLHWERTNLKVLEDIGNSLPTEELLEKCKKYLF